MWIHASHAVPHDSIEVIVTDGVHVTTAWYEKGFGVWHSGMGGSDVTHWTPLPSPPNSDNAEPNAASTNSAMVPCQHVLDGGTNGGQYECVKCGALFESM